MLIALVSVSIATPAQAKIDPFDGIPHATIEVNGKSYSFPIGTDMSGRERSNDVYYLKKLLKGDSEARDMFLGGESERSFFIGRETPKWIKVTKNDVIVIE